MVRPRRGFATDYWSFAVRPRMGFAAEKMGSHVCGVVDFVVMFVVLDEEEEDDPPKKLRIFVCPGSNLEAFLLTLVSRRLVGLCMTSVSFLGRRGSFAKAPHVFFCSSYCAICSSEISGSGSSIRGSVMINSGLAGFWGLL